VNTQTRAEFDQYARDYMQELSHPLRNLVDPEGNYFIELKSRILQEIAALHFHSRRSIHVVDVGTGLGLFEKFLIPAFDDILAIDISYEMLKVANVINPFTSNTSGYVQGNAYHLPLEDDHADLVFMSCVLHHLEGNELEATLQEMARVCSPDGYIVFFEHNPYNPFTQLVVKTTPLDINAKLVSHKKLEHFAVKAGIRIRSREFFLYGTRKIDTIVNRIFPAWHKYPFGGQYALIGQKAK